MLLRPTERLLMDIALRRVVHLPATELNKRNIPECDFGVNLTGATKALNINNSLSSSTTHTSSEPHRLPSRPVRIPQSTQWSFFTFIVKIPFTPKVFRE